MANEVNSIHLIGHSLNTALRLWGHTFHGIAESPAHRNFEDFGPQICVASRRTKPFQDSLVWVTIREDLHRRDDEGSQGPQTTQDR